MLSLKKVLLCCLFAVLVATVSIMGTLAYLTDRDSVTNTFTVGNVTITLDEAKVNPDGTPVEGAARVKKNSYHLIPGQAYTKDPTMTVIKGSEESYVRMIVKIDHYDELTAIFGDPFLPQYFVEGWDNTTWITTRVITEDETNNTATYEFRYKETVKPEANADLKLDALFDSIKVPAELTGEQLATIADLNITVIAHAIQAAGFETEDNAWLAFDEQNEQ